MRERRHIRRLGPRFALLSALVALTACTVTYLPDPPPRTTTVTISPGWHACSDGQVGITVDEQLYVIGLVQDGPAWRAGILHGDLVVAVAGERVFSIAQAQFRAAGPPGTAVTISIQRPGERSVRTYTLMRACLS